MINLWGALLYGCLAAVVFVSMVKFTNQKRQFNEEEYTQIFPYVKSTAMCAVFFLAIFVTALCGGLIFRSAVSRIAIVKLSVCYFSLLGAAIIDYKLRIIPNFIPIILIGSRVLIFLYELIFKNVTLQSFILPLIGCLLCALSLLLGKKLSRGGIGGGDIKLLIAVGLICGAYTMFTVLLLALLCCSVFAIIVTLTKKMTIKQSVPFGPFIYIAYVLMCILSMY